MASSQVTLFVLSLIITSLKADTKSVRYVKLSNQEPFVCPSEDRVFLKPCNNHVTCTALCRTRGTCKSVFLDVSIGTCYGCNKVYPTSVGLVQRTGGATIHYMDEKQAVGLTQRHFGIVCEYRNGQWGTVCDDGRCDHLNGHKQANFNVLFDRLGPTTLSISCSVYRNGQWGTVCDDGWYDHLNGHKQANLNVLCGSLGFNSGSVLEPGTYSLTDASTIPIWMDGVMCTGSEHSLLNCPYNGLGQHDCGHDEDLIVSCYNE